MTFVDAVRAAFVCHHGLCTRKHICNPFGVYCQCGSTFEQGCQAPYPSTKETHAQ